MQAAIPRHGGAHEHVQATGRPPLPLKKSPTKAATPAPIDSILPLFQSQSSAASPGLPKSVLLTDELIDPLLSRMTLASLGKLFENELAFLCKCMESFGRQRNVKEESAMLKEKTLQVESHGEREPICKDGAKDHHCQRHHHHKASDTPSNSQPGAGTSGIAGSATSNSLKTKTKNSRRRLLISQLERLLKTFEKHLPPNYMGRKIVELGEKMVTFGGGFHDVAERLCFSKYLEDYDVSLRGKSQVMHDPADADVKGEETNQVTSTDDEVGALELHYRARYGRALCWYHDLCDVDPLLKNAGEGPTSTLAGLRELLDEIKHIVDLCVAREDMVSLVKAGTVYLRMITRHMGECELWSEAVDYLEAAVNAIETCIPLMNAESLPWRLELYHALSECVSESNKRKTSKSTSPSALETTNNLVQQIFNRAKTTTHEIVTFEKSACESNGEDLPPHKRHLLETALKKIDFWIFAGDLKTLVLKLQKVNREGGGIAGSNFAAFGAVAANILSSLQFRAALIKRKDKEGGRTAPRLNAANLADGSMGVPKHLKQTFKKKTKFSAAGNKRSIIQAVAVSASKEWRVSHTVVAIRNYRNVTTTSESTTNDAIRKFLRGSEKRHGRHRYGTPSSTDGFRGSLESIATNLQFDKDRDFDPTFSRVNGDDEDSRPQTEAADTARNDDDSVLPQQTSSPKSLKKDLFPGSPFRDAQAAPLTADPDNPDLMIERVAAHEIARLLFERFTTDVDRFHAIIAAVIELSASTTNAHKDKNDVLHFFEERVKGTYHHPRSNTGAKHERNMDEVVLWKAMDFAIELIKSDTFLSEQSHLMDCAVHVAELGRLPIPSFVNYMYARHSPTRVGADGGAYLRQLIEDGRVYQFNLNDLMTLARQLFQYRQYWDRFCALASLIMETISVDVGEQDEVGRSIAPMGIELKIRTALIDFVTTHHAERKVLFGMRLTEPNTPSTDEEDGRDSYASAQFDIPDRIEKTFYSLLAVVSEGLGNEALLSPVGYSSIFPSSAGPKRAAKLFVDVVAMALWRFAEPYVRDLEEDTDPKKFEHLPHDSVIIAALHCAHSLFAHFPSQRTLLGLRIGCKLALLYEVCGMHTEAVQVLQEMLERVHYCRRLYENAVEGKYAAFSALLGSASCTLGFHPTITSDLGLSLPKKVWPSQHQPQHQRSHQGHFNPGEDDMVVLTTELPVMEVHIFSALSRCQMKRRYVEALTSEKVKQDERIRLSKKRPSHAVITTVMSIQDVETICGENPLYQALFFAVHASAESNIPQAEKHVLLKRATDLLAKARQAEARLLSDISYTSKLLGSGGKAHVSTNIQACCAAPLFVRRSPTSISIRARPSAGVDGSLVVESTYQAFAQRCSKALKVSLSDVEYYGTGIPVSGATSSEIIIRGLEPNNRYFFAVGAFNEDQQMISDCIGDTSFPILACFPIPLDLCWGHISIIAHVAKCEEVADLAHRTLCEYFLTRVESKENLLRSINDSQSGVEHEPVFELNPFSILEASDASTRLFIQSIFAKIDRTFVKALATGMSLSVQQNPEGSKDVVAAATMRLEAARDLLIACTLAEHISNFEYMLMCAIKCFEIIQPLLDIELPSRFLVHCLLECHRRFSASILLVEDIDRAQAVKDCFVPMCNFAVRYLVKIRTRSSSAALIKLAEESLAVMNKCIQINDLRIMSSNLIEENWIGEAKKIKKIRYGKKPKANMIAEFQYHAIISTCNSRPLLGYDGTKQRPVDDMSEYLDIVMAMQNITRHHSSATPVMLPDQRQETISRHLESQTSLRELYILLQIVGPELIYQQLNLFRKNPRYLELAVRCINFCLFPSECKAPGLYSNAAMNENPELAVKLCGDLFDWVDLRNRAMQNCEIYFDGADERREKILKRKKRVLYVERHAARTVFERRSRSRSKKPMNTDMAKQKKATNAHFQKVKVDGDFKPFSDNLNDSNSRASSPRGSRQSSVTRERSESEHNTTEFKRRKQHYYKLQFFASMGESEKASKEDALKTLDDKLSALWRRKRIGRRLRLIVAFESGWRARLCYLHAKALQLIVERDLRFEGSVKQNLETFEFRRCGRMLLQHFDIPETYKSSAKTVQPQQQQQSSQPRPPSATTANRLQLQQPEMQKYITDMLQSFVQSAVLAARAKQWTQVWETCRSFWTIHRKLSCGLLSMEFWRDNMWRGLYIAGDALMDMLHAVHVAMPSDHWTEITAIFSKHHQTNDMLNIGAFATDRKLARRSSQRSKVVPCSTMDDLESKEYVATWFDDDTGEFHRMLLDFSWCSQFLLFTMESMHSAQMYHRLMQFGGSVNRLFNGVFAPWIAPVLKHVQDELGVMAPDVPMGLLKAEGTGQIWVKLMSCWSLHSQYALEKSCQFGPDDAQSRTFRRAVDAYIALQERAPRIHGDPVARFFASYGYGNILHENGDSATASTFWSRAVDEILKTEHFIYQASANEVDHGLLVQAAGCYAHAILAAIAILKIARYTCWDNLDQHERFLTMAASLLVSPLIQVSGEDASYTLAFHSIRESLRRFPLRCDPDSLMETLQYTISHLMDYENYARTVPLLEILIFLAKDVYENSSLLALALLWKAEYLTNTGQFAEAITTFFSIARGDALTRLDRRRSLPSTFNTSLQNIRFDNTQALSSPNNANVLRVLADHRVNDNILGVYGQQFSKDYELRRCRILLRILKLGGGGDPMRSNPRIANAFAHYDKNVDGGSSTQLQQDDEKKQSPRSGSVVKPAQESIDPDSAQDLASPAQTEEGASGKESKNNVDVVIVTIQRLEENLTRMLSNTRRERRLSTGNVNTAKSNKLDHQLLRIHKLLSDLYILKNESLMAAKNLFEMEKIVEASGSKESNKHVWERLRTRRTLVECLLAERVFEHAKSLAGKGLKDAFAAGSKKLHLLFFGLGLKACVGSGNYDVCARSTDIALYRQTLEKYGPELPDEDGDVLAHGWELLGDIYSDVPLTASNSKHAYLSALHWLRKFHHMAPNLSKISNQVTETAYDPRKVDEFRLLSKLAYAHHGDNLSHALALSNEALSIAKATIPVPGDLVTPFYGLLGVMYARSRFAVQPQTYEELWEKARKCAQQVIDMEQSVAALHKAMLALLSLESDSENDGKRVGELVYAAALLGQKLDPSRHIEPADLQPAEPLTTTPHVLQSGLLWLKKNSDPSSKLDDLFSALPENTRQDILTGVDPTALVDYLWELEQKRPKPFYRIPLHSWDITTVRQLSRTAFLSTSSAMPTLPPGNFFCIQWVELPVKQLHRKGFEVYMVLLKQTQIISKPEAKPEIKAESKSEIKSETKNDTKTDGKVDARNDIKSNEASKPSSPEARSLPNSAKTRRSTSKRTSQPSLDVPQIYRGKVKIVGFFRNEVAEICQTLDAMTTARSESDPTGVVQHSFTETLARIRRTLSDLQRSAMLAEYETSTGSAETRQQRASQVSGDVQQPLPDAETLDILKKVFNAECGYIGNHEHAIERWFASYV
ncbi:hypothetical protein HK102_000715 [Quaeritorhiza haematococci]|nr:hypothetical protein HK102_000715 [Quaeritorhiza haematococci]